MAGRSGVCRSEIAHLKLRKRRESIGDGLYTDVNTLGVRAGASDARFIGTQAQIAATWQATRHINAQVHLVRFWAGDYIEEAGGADQAYFHVGLTYLF